MPSPTTGLHPAAPRRRAAVVRAGSTAAVLIALAAAALSACTSSPSAGPSNDTRSSAGSTLAPSAIPPTTPVPAPNPGTIRQPVLKASVHVYTRVPLGRRADFATGLPVQVLSANIFHARGHMPGEISGAAVRVTVQITNHTRRAVSLAGIAPTCTDARGTPLVAMQSAPVRAFAGSLAAGRSARAIYVFELARVAPASSRFTIALDNSATHSVVQFYGRAS